MTNVVSLFPTVATTTEAVDYSEAKQGTTHWNVPTCKASDVGTTLFDQLESKGVFYTVDGRDNFVQNDAGDFVSTGKKTIYNVTNEKTLGVMSQGYKIAQNEQIFLAALREIDNAGIDTSNAFTRVRVDNDGERVMAEIVFPETKFDVTVGDTVALSISVTNSFDGSGAFSIKMGAFRFICANGMVSPSGIIAYKSAHTASLNIGFAAKTIVSGLAQYQEDSEAMLLQAQTPVTEQTVYEALCIMNKIDSSKVETYAQYMSEVRPTLKRQPAIERHMGLWNKYKSELGSTQWALNNVLTHISTHGDKPEYTASNKITTRTTKEALVGKALNHMLAA